METVDSGGRGGKILWLSGRPPNGGRGGGRGWGRRCKFKTETTLEKHLAQFGVML